MSKSDAVEVRADVMTEVMRMYSVDYVMGIDAMYERKLGVKWVVVEYVG
jgi:hypothetical protein